MEEEVRCERRIITHNTYTTAGVFFCCFVCCDFFSVLFSFSNASFCLFLGVLFTTWSSEDRVIATFNVIGHSGEALQMARTSTRILEGPGRPPSYPQMRPPEKEAGIWARAMLPPKSSGDPTENALFSWLQL